MNQIPPELLQALLASGVDVGNQQDSVDQQRKMAELLRGQAANAQAGGQGMNVSNGRIFVAGNPLSQFGSAAANYMARQADARGDQAQSGVRAAQGNQYQQILTALLRNRPTQKNSVPQPYEPSEADPYL